MENENCKYLIESAYDLHMQIGPDIMPRKLNDAHMYERAVAAGMAGFSPRSHYHDTGERCALLNAGQSSTKAIGAISLNQSVGGINPYAVEIAARGGTKLVWFPTQDSKKARSVLNSGKPIEKLPHWAKVVLDMEINGVASEPIYILDNVGKLIEPVYDTLDIISRHDMTLFTGNISYEEAIALVKAARERKVERIVVAMVDHPAVNYSLKQQKEFAAYGAYMEHCYNTYAGGKVELAEALHQIKAIGHERVIISSDLGQPSGIYPDEGMLAYAQELVKAGFSETEVKQMTGGNAGRLLS